MWMCLDIIISMTIHQLTDMGIFRIQHLHLSPQKMTRCGDNGGFCVLWRLAQFSGVPRCPIHRTALLWPCGVRAHCLSRWHQLHSSVARAPTAFYHSPQSTLQHSIHQNKHFVHYRVPYHLPHHENADKTPGKSPVANGQSPFRLEKPETWTPILSSLSAMDLHCSYCIRLVPHTYTFHRAAPGVNRRQQDLIGLTHSHFQV